MKMPLEIATESLERIRDSANDEWTIGVCDEAFAEIEREEKARWVPFSVAGDLPAERRYVLVAIAGLHDDRGSHSPSTAVGYLRYSAGELDSPFFVVPGFGRPFEVTHWCDCLVDGFRSPSWPLSTGEHGYSAMTLEQRQAEIQARTERMSAEPNT